MSAPSKFNLANDFDSEDTVNKFIQTRPSGLIEIQARVIIDQLKQLRKTDKKSGCLLDVGCGNGEITRLLAKNFHHTIGVDPSFPMISKAIGPETKCPEIEFKVTRAEELPIEDNSVDVITGISMLNYVDLQAFIPECKRVLKSGGVALFYRDQISKMLSAEDDSLPVIEAPVKLMIKCLSENARKMSHYSYHTHDLHQIQFGEINWEIKSRIVNEIDFAHPSLSTLASWCRFYSHLPFYEKVAESGVNPAAELVQSVKENWSMQDRDPDDIKIKAVYKTVMILLQ